MPFFLAPGCGVFGWSRCRVAGASRPALRSGRPSPRRIAGAVESQGTRRSAAAGCPVSSQDQAARGLVCSNERPSSDQVGRVGGVEFFNVQ